MTSLDMSYMHFKIIPVHLYYTRVDKDGTVNVKIAFFETGGSRVVLLALFFDQSLFV